MITRENAANTLLKNIHDLFQKQGSISKEDLEAETINTACLDIIREFGSSISSTHNIDDLESYICINVSFSKYAVFYTKALHEFYPEEFSSEMAAVLTMLIIQNISYAGMWDFLRNYYQEKHQWAIDNTEVDIEIFDSGCHQRYQWGIPDEPTPAIRKVILNFTNERKDMTVRVEPTLSEKKAHLINRNGNEAEYKGYDPDYSFYIKYNNFGGIDRFIVEMHPRGIKIVYTL